MCKAAADRAAIANRGVRNMGDRICQQRGKCSDFRRFQDIYVARQPADGEHIASDRDPPKFGKLADIDNQFGRDQAQIHGRHQALAA